MPTTRQLYTTAPVPDRTVATFDELAGLDANVTSEELARAPQDPDWHVDTDGIDLPAEMPGPPAPDGSFAHARRILEWYEFADQRLIRAVFDAASPFEGRDMLLVGRFLGLRFPMGVRVGGVVDGELVERGRPVRLFAWHYRTLEGHLERGQMDYELRKHVDTGQVSLRIHARSRMARIDNPVVRLGFRVFGRRSQLRFYDRALARTAAMVAERRGRPVPTAPGGGM